MDFVNQSVLQISGHDVESKRSDKTDFAERLGAMNRRWQILQGRINERVSNETHNREQNDHCQLLVQSVHGLFCIKHVQIQFLESLLEMWLEYESSVQALKSWMGNQEERLKRKHRIEDLTSVQNALKDCQVGLTCCVNTDSSKHIVPLTCCYYHQNLLSYCFFLLSSNF